jgi:hypothetical protein
MKNLTDKMRRRTVSTALLVMAVLTPQVATADQNGISFWLPGQSGSLAAVPQVPGWSMAAVYYHTTVSGDASLSTTTQIKAGRFNPSVDFNISGNLNARADLVILSPTYVFASPVLGGQLAVGVGGTFGKATTSVDGTIHASLGGPGITRPFSRDDSLTGVGDLYPKVSLRWNQGVHNFMVYGMADVPVGAYDATRMSNLGIGHWALDAGVGYTYFNPHTGHELSAVTGFTYNFKNPSTDYRNGIDWHLDWGASQFLSKQVHVGLVGYVYQQITADSGQLAVLGDMKSRVLAIGPQVGFIFPVGEMHGYLNVKAYKEFDNDNRPSGWNAWVTFAISPAAAPPPARMVKK